MDPHTKVLRIEEMKDEVMEFHPLLQNVLPKLPGVKSVDYTHGPHERGADFVVQVESQTTRRVTFVGVVAKCGKIGAGQIPAVEEQIKECSEERSYEILKKVRCNEVWVFTTGGFSERAKEKLLDRVSGRSIEFFGPSDIATFVDNHFPYFWLDLPRDLGEYLQTLSERLTILDRSTSVVIGATTSELRIPLDTFERVRKSYQKTSSAKPSVRNVDFVHEATTSKFSLLEADMGFGKSTLARQLAHSLCNAESFHKLHLVPVFSTYKNFRDRYADDLGRLIETTLGSALKVVDDKKVSVLVILDGIDESATAEQSAAHLLDNLLKQLQTHARVRLVVTSRPMKSLADKATAYTEARVFGIRPLSLKKIVQYVEATCSSNNLPARLFQDLKKSPLFRQLPQSPIAAALFSNLLAQSHHEVPQSLTELFSKSTELMLGRWDQKKELTTEKLFKTIQFIAEDLATYFVDNRLIYVSRDEFQDRIRDYLRKRNVGVEAREVEHVLLERSTVFRVDEETGTVAFRHRSFAEFLCAQRKSRDRSLEVNDSSLDPYWTNVFFFYVGTLLDCPEVLEQLQAVQPKSETQEWMKLLSVPSYLLAAYQTEYEQVERNVVVVLLDAASLYLRVRSSEAAPRLAGLSEMHLLYLFKSLVVESLSYEFFERGFPNVYLELQKALVDEQVRVYALFFLSCAWLEQGKDDGFQTLVSDYGVKKLPMPLCLATTCELETHSGLENSKLVKRHRDSLRKALFGDARTDSGRGRSKRLLIEDFFEKPLRARTDLVEKR